MQALRRPRGYDIDRARLALALALAGACTTEPAPAKGTAPAHAEDCRADHRDACAPACLDGDQASCKEAIDARRADAWKTPQSEKLLWDLLDRACGLLSGRPHARVSEAGDRL
jgi:hypothetical protein